MFDERRKEYEELLFYLEELKLGYRLVWRGNIEEETSFEWDLTLVTPGEADQFYPKLFIQHKWDKESIMIACTSRMKPYTIKSPALVRTVDEEYTDGSGLSIIYKYGKGISMSKLEQVMSKVVSNEVNFSELKDFIGKLV